MRTGLRTVVFMGILLGLLAPALTAAPKAWLVRRIQDYKDIKRIEEEPAMYIFQDDAFKTVYSWDESGKEKTEVNAWEIKDLLYSDVPSEYKSALELLAEDKFEEARDMFTRALNAQTEESKKKFSSTDIAKNYMDVNLLTCALGLNDLKNADTLFEKIESNQKAHGWVNSMILYVDRLVEKEDGAKAQKLAEKLLALQQPPKADLGNRTLLKLRFNCAMALGFQRKFKEAKEALYAIRDEFSSSFPEVADQVIEKESYMLVYVEKDYSAAIRFFEKMMKVDSSKITGKTYASLAYCHENKKDYPRARWYYILAYNAEMNEDLHAGLLDKVLEMNNKVKSDSGNAEIAQFIKMVKEIGNENKENAK